MLTDGTAIATAARDRTVAMENFILTGGYGRLLINEGMEGYL